NVSSSGQPIVSEPDAQLVLNAALKLCDPKVGLMLDYRSCERKFDLDSLECTGTATANCRTPAQIPVFEKIYDGPVDPQGEHLFPGGYPLGSEWSFDNPTSVNIPATPGAPVIPGAFITAWLHYFAFEKDIGTAGVANEPFTKP